MSDPLLSTERLLDDLADAVMLPGTPEEVDVMQIETILQELDRIDPLEIPFFCE